MNNNIPWVEKYRPSNLDDIIYHKEIINTLKKLIKTADQDWKKKFAWMFK